jgi:hypothetical protein
MHGFIIPSPRRDPLFPDLDKKAANEGVLRTKSFFSEAQIYMTPTHVGIAAAAALGVAWLIEAQLLQTPDKPKERNWVNVGIIFVIVFGLGISALLFWDNGMGDAMINMKGGEPGF